MAVVNLIAFIIVLIGCFNWGMVGIFDWNLVGAITGGAYNVWSAIIYILVFLASIWLIYAAIVNRGRININPNVYDKRNNDIV